MSPNNTKDKRKRLNDSINWLTDSRWSKRHEMQKFWLKHFTKNYEIPTIHLKKLWVKKATQPWNAKFKFVHSRYWIKKSCVRNLLSYVPQIWILASIMKIKLIMLKFLKDYHSRKPWDACGFFLVFMRYMHDLFILPISLLWHSFPAIFPY